VANGHDWEARWTELPGDFGALVIHSHDYKTAEGYEGEKVLVVGFGNSAMDIASETSRVSEMTYLSVRRGAHVIPKYLKGRPVDELNTPFTSRLPLGIQRAIYQRMLRKLQGRMTDYGLPEPDHKIAEAHPTISAEILNRIVHGRVKPKPNIERLERDRVRFVDGSVEEIDQIVYCTGYKITFPFFEPDLLAATESNHINLYRRVVPPGTGGLYFIGLLQPLGAIMPLAEAQSEWVADLLQGRAMLPSEEQMRKAIGREDARMSRRYVTSARHTIQVDFYDYLRTIARERKRRRGHPVAALRADRSHELRVGTPA
jgi:hypothetical protein